MEDKRRVEEQRQEPVVEPASEYVPYTDDSAVATADSDESEHRFHQILRHRRFTRAAGGWR